MDFKTLQDAAHDVKDNPLAFIRFYEANADSIQKLDDSDNKQRSFKLKMNGDYGTSLAANGNIVNAVKVLSTLLPRFEQYSGLSETELVNHPYYEQLLWAYGSSLYYTQSIDDAEKIFERLLKLYPDNQKYKNWLRATKEKRYSTLRTGILISLVVWIFSNILWGRSMEGDVRLIFFFTGGGIICGAIIMEAYLFFLRRKFR